MYQSFVFLEIRVLIVSNEKAFCSCKTGTSTECCPICMRMDGKPPVLKKRVAQDAYRLAQSLGCKLIEKTPYEYPSGMPVLPPEYHLCGASVKVAEKGVLDIEFHKHRKQIEILEIRIEEDAGRLIHTDGTAFMDYSTAGMPSIRIRTGNNLELGEEAEMFLTELSSRMRYIGLLTDSDTSHKIRCNAYTASTEIPNTPQHYVKLRNLNSFNFVRKAVNEDLRRQEQLLKQGIPLTSESRLWNARLERTEPYKTRDFIDHVQIVPIHKEYFYTAPRTLLRTVLKTAPENQHTRKLRYVQSLGLSVPAAQALCGDAELAAFFDSVVTLGIDPKTAASGILSDVAALLKRENKPISAVQLQPNHYAQLLRLAQKGTLNHTIVRKLLTKIIVENAEPSTVLAQEEWIKISDYPTLRTLVQESLNQYPEEAAQLKAGAMKYLDILCGTVMKKTSGFADQELVKYIIKEELQVSIVYILAMDKLVASFTNKAGTQQNTEKPPTLSPFIETAKIEYPVCVEQLLSHGVLSPESWAQLIHVICTKIASGTAKGIVLLYEAAPLTYIAPLLYWLFADTPIPIVLTAPATVSESYAIQSTITNAIHLASQKDRGIYVLFNGAVLSPLNIRYEGGSSDQHSCLINWNMKQLLFQGVGLLTDYEGSDQLVFESLLSEATERMVFIKTYPGIQQAFLLPLLKNDIHTFFLELYENELISAQGYPPFLKEFLKRGKKQQCRFYATSQQGGLTRNAVESKVQPEQGTGIIPIGMFTSETAIALYYAASLVCDTEEELDHIMEAATRFQLI